MIAHLTGTILDILPTSIVVDVHGVGYEVFVSETHRRTTVMGSEVSLTIATIVKEDSLELFGFATGEERRVFQLLLTVSGVGPRTALTIISHGVASITRAIATADVGFFTSIPRIGKKNAQKIIIELKPKLGDIDALDLADKTSSQSQELLEALTAMGFARQKVVDIIQHEINTEDPIETNIRKALRILGKQNSI